MTLSIGHMIKNLLNFSREEKSSFPFIKMELPAIIEQIVFHSIEENLDLAIQKTMNLFDTNFPYSFNLIICNLIYSLFYSKKNEVEIYLNYLEIIQIKEQELNNSKIIEVFAKYLSKIKTQEAFYLIEKMIELKLIDSNITKNIKSIYFAHYKTKKENKKKYFNDLFCKPFLKNIEELSKNDWELHKQLIKEGVNPNEIAKIIRNDEIEKLQEISSQSNFDFNQSIEPSLYERYDFINQKNVTLIDYSAFFSSVKCFKYLLVNGANVENTGKYAIAGGNEEIIHLCEQNHSSFEAACETAIKFHRNDIFKYFYEKNIENKLEKANKLINVCSNYGNYEIFSFLKDKKIKIRHKFINDLARNGNLYLIKCLFHKDQYPKNILISSIESENIELVKFILEQKCIDINTKNYGGKTPLMFASIFGYTEVVKLLLQQEGININAKNKNGKTALMFASFYNHIEIVKILLEQEGIKINSKNKFNGNTALILSAQKSNTEIAKMLLEQKDISVNVIGVNGKTALIFSVQNGNIEIVKLLLKHKEIYVNTKGIEGNTALMLASYSGNTEIVKILLQQIGIDINVKDYYGNTALMKASEKGHTEIVNLLLQQKGIDINAKNRGGNTSLMLASYGGHTEIVKLLLEQKGTIINYIDRYGKTALIIASEKGYTEIVKLLLEQKGVNINNKDYDGKTAFIKASSNGHIEIVKLMIYQEGIDINAKDNLGDTALTLASRYGHIEIVKLLSKREGIDVNTKNIYGDTALTLASEYGHIEIVKLLSKQIGIDVNTKNMEIQDLILNYE